MPFAPGSVKALGYVGGRPVAIGEVAGTFTLRAEADGLTPAVLKITLK